MLDHQIPLEVFPAEVQLSGEYARFNNLHRHGNLNADQGQAGYLEDNRRVRALKFRGWVKTCMITSRPPEKYLIKRMLYLR